jgi:hypothetical protein
MPMSQDTRARRIAQAIEQLLLAPAGDDAVAGGFKVSRRCGCVACNPGVCSYCGHVFTGEVIEISHASKGKRVLSDKAVHYLAHGVTTYETGWTIRGQPVVVDLDVEEVASYLDL